ncbi:hypothetical protein [Streptomyces sp. NPDC048277]|uniref:lysylphosphatidylglycerol synthase domain-containing protein n=1 Tax=Streptomyces sp. NPDC048277 TaxID=3155027 RepID=UPI0033E90A25
MTAADRSVNPDRRGRRGRRLSAAGTTPAVTATAATAALCWWALRGVDRAALAHAARGTDVTVVALVALGYTAAFSLLDVARFTLVYRRHLAPHVPVRDVTVIVCGKQLLGVFFPPLTKLIAPLYFRRRWQVGAIRTLGATEVLTVADGIVVVTCVGAGAAFGGGLPGGAVPVGSAIATVLAAFLLWMWLPAARRVLPRVRGSAFLSVIARTRPAEMAVQLLLRFGGVVAMCAAWQVLTLAVGADLGRERLAQFCAVFLLATQLPLSVGGYGGPQGVCVLLLTDTWHLLSRADAVALSLLWSSMYLLSRALLSSLFVIPMVRLLKGVPPLCAAEPNGN